MPALINSHFLCIDELEQMIKEFVQQESIIKYAMS